MVDARYIQVWMVKPVEALDDGTPSRAGSVALAGGPISIALQTTDLMRGRSTRSGHEGKRCCVHRSHDGEVLLVERSDHVNMVSLRERNHRGVHYPERKV